MKIQSRTPFFCFPQRIEPIVGFHALSLSICRAASAFALIFTFSAEIFAQSSDFASDPTAEDYSMIYFAVIVLGIASLGAIFWMRSKRKLEMYPVGKTETTIRRAGVRPASNSGVDKKVDDWLQAGFSENKKRTTENGSSNGFAKKSNNAANGFNDNSAKKKTVNFETFNRESVNKEPAPTAFSGDANGEANFWQLTPPQPYELLPSAADDESVLDALEQLKEDEDDEMMRSLAIRVLSASKSQESVEGLTQVALYDQTVRHRIEAIMALGAFDHPSVFEPILLAGADPSREVRAAAARALSRLSFDRPDAFVRVIGSRDAERLRLAALACVESGFAARAFERLSSSDGKQSYEAFAILTLLIKAGEYRPILQTIAEHPSLQVRLATVKVLHNLNSSKMSAALYDLSLRDDLPEEVKAALNELLFHLNTAV